MTLAELLHHYVQQAWIGLPQLKYEKRVTVIAEEGEKLQDREAEEKSDPHSMTLEAGSESRSILSLVTTIKETGNIGYLPLKFAMVTLGVRQNKIV